MRYNPAHVMAYLAGGLIFPDWVVCKDITECVIMTRIIGHIQANYEMEN